MAELLHSMPCSNFAENDEVDGNGENDGGGFGEQNDLSNSDEAEQSQNLDARPDSEDFVVVQNRLPALSEIRYNRREFSTREVLKAKLKYHYMNPWQKWKVKGRKPWKLVIQILKIIIVTVQVRG